MATYKSEFTKGLDYFHKLSKDRVRHGYVIYMGESDHHEKKQWRVLNYCDLDQIN